MRLQQIGRHRGQHQIQAHSQGGRAVKHHLPGDKSARGLALHAPQAQQQEGQQQHIDHAAGGPDQLVDAAGQRRLHLHEQVKGEPAADGQGAQLESAGTHRGRVAQHLLNQNQPHDGQQQCAEPGQAVYARRATRQTGQRLRRDSQQQHDRAQRQRAARHPSAQRQRAQRDQQADGGGIAQRVQCQHRPQRHRPAGGVDSYYGSPRAHGQQCPDAAAPPGCTRGDLGHEGRGSHEDRCGHAIRESCEVHGLIMTSRRSQTMNGVGFLYSYTVWKGTRRTAAVTNYC